jgi:hypothetical protein
MKVGDLVKYGGIGMTGCICVVLYINDAGGTVKAVNDDGSICWLVTSDCEVISESR